ncbi:serine/arginine repetitive matrix protein 2-like [Scyliorhinus canicula]|uniref:serine/arginine repetitive matrix protein 2-like n=1 Tax=Scyliorhinus canicula TaxID=7830 RepID=UPI0018F41FDA|nr:serine/arginine repetitive matrix protein 2-like [Scyliorhinus canicula]
MDPARARTPSPVTISYTDGDQAEASHTSDEFRISSLENTASDELESIMSLAHEIVATQHSSGTKDRASDSVCDFQAMEAPVAETAGGKRGSTGRCKDQAWSPEPEPVPPDELELCCLLDQRSDMEPTASRLRLRCFIAGSSKPWSEGGPQPVFTSSPAGQRPLSTEPPSGPASAHLLPEQPACGCVSEMYRAAESIWEAELSVLSHTDDYSSASGMPLEISVTDLGLDCLTAAFSESPPLSPQLSLQWQAAAQRPSSRLPLLATEPQQTGLYGNSCSMLSPMPTSVSCQNLDPIRKSSIGPSQHPSPGHSPSLGPSQITGSIYSPSLGPSPSPRSGNRQLTASSQSPRTSRSPSLGPSQASGPNPSPNLGRSQSPQPSRWPSPSLDPSLPLGHTSPPNLGSAPGPSQRLSSQPSFGSQPSTSPSVHFPQPVNSSQTSNMGLSRHLESQTGSNWSPTQSIQSTHSLQLGRTSVQENDPRNTHSSGTSYVPSMVNMSSDIITSRTIESFPLDRRSEFYRYRNQGSEQGSRGRIVDSRLQASHVLGPQVRPLNTKDEDRRIDHTYYGNVQMEYLYPSEEKKS